MLILITKMKESRFFSQIPPGAPSKGEDRYTTPVLQRELSF
jgi:hypothetical protein